MNYALSKNEANLVAYEAFLSATSSLLERTINLINYQDKMVTAMLTASKNRIWEDCEWRQESCISRYFLCPFVRLECTFHAIKFTDPSPHIYANSIIHKRSDSYRGQTYLARCGCKIQISFSPTLIQFWKFFQIIHYEIHVPIKNLANAKWIY